MNIKYIYWELSNYCNLRCKQCFANAIGDKTTIIDKDILYKAINKISDKTDISIRFGGGEPLLIPYLADLIYFCNTKGINVDITSNGLLLDWMILKKLFSAGLRELTISIDGLKSTNDFLRGSGSFEKVDNVLTSIIPLYKRQISIGYTVTKVNYHEIINFAEEFILKGIRKFYFFRYCGSTNKDLCSLNTKQLQEASTMIQELIIKYPHIQFVHELSSFYSFVNNNSSNNMCHEGCNFLRGVISINYKGDVIVCAAIDKIIGNIFVDEVTDIIHSIEDEQKMLKIIPESCKKCVYAISCHGGCKAESYRKYNNYLNRDTLCYCIAKR